MVAVAIPSKMLIERMFELSNSPAGLHGLWVRNIGKSKLFAGKINWCEGKPCRMARSALL